jgi:glycosyltransferase 2 family protein
VANAKLTTHHVKRLLVTFLKVAFSAAIVGYLVYDVTHGKGHQNVFTNLVHQKKHWGMLAVAWVCCFLAVLLTFIRWWFLIRALGIPCRFRDSIRISFWGFLFNLAPLGIVGGDLVKAVMLDHEHRGYRAKAVASVFADRIIGLYVLFIFATATILLTGYYWDVAAVPDVHIWGRIFIGLKGICWAMFVITLLSTLGLAAVMAPGPVAEGVVAAIGRIPRAGHALKSLLDAVRMYRSKPGVLALSSVMSVGVHGLFAVGCFFIACGLPGEHLSLAKHLVVMPLSAAVQVVPLPIGPTEGMLEFLYRYTPPGIAEGQGLVVALAYRIITVLIAVLGVLCYFRNRREMAEVMHEAEEE